MRISDWSSDVCSSDLRAMNGVMELEQEYDRDPQVKRLIDLARKLEGLPRHSSTHAAGVVIGDRPLSHLVPLYRDPRSDMPVTPFDLKYVEGAEDRKRVVEGMSVSVRVDLGGRHIITKKRKI